MTEELKAAVEWFDLSTAPVGVPVIVQYRPFNRHESSVTAEQVAWRIGTEWRKYPSLEQGNIAYADYWRPIPAIRAPDPHAEALAEALKAIKYQSTNHGGWFEQDPFGEYSKLGETARTALANYESRAAGEVGAFVDVGENRFADNVIWHGPTHWLPLPTPPKGEA